MRKAVGEGDHSLDMKYTNLSSYVIVKPAEIKPELTHQIDCELVRHHCPKLSSS